MIRSFKQSLDEAIALKKGATPLRQYLRQCYPAIEDLISRGYDLDQVAQYLSSEEFPLTADMIQIPLRKMRDAHRKRMRRLTQNQQLSSKAQDSKCSASAEQ